MHKASFQELKDRIKKQCKEKTRLYCDVKTKAKNNIYFRHSSDEEIARAIKELLDEGILNTLVSEQLIQG